jgi:hypothetical protein
MEEKVQHATLQKHSQQRAPLIGNTVNQRAISPCWHCQKTLLDRPLNSVLAEGRDFFPKFVTLFIHGFSGEFLNIAVVSFLLSPTRKGDPNLSQWVLISRRRIPRRGCTRRAEAKLGYVGHVLMDNRSGLVENTRVTHRPRQRQHGRSKHNRTRSNPLRSNWPSLQPKPSGCRQRLPLSRRTMSGATDSRRLVHRAEP